MKAKVAPLEATELFDVLNYAPVGVLVEDCEGMIVWVNHTLAWQLGVEGGELIGDHTGSLPLEPLPGARGKRLFRAPPTQEQGPERRLKCIEDILPEYSESGIRVRYFMESGHEERRPKAQNHLLRMLTSRPRVDRLTGLQDRDGILRTLRNEVSRSRRYGNPLTAVVMRVEPPPRSGAVLDHPSLTLSSASGLLRDSTRWADSVGRCDDWEFLLVLPETTASAATQLIRKLRACVESSQAFTARFGTAEWRRGEDEIVLLARAREATADAAV